ncbi:hypothetical protein ACE193_14780 [Bernardetia sp. OM2101]
MYLLLVGTPKTAIFAIVGVPLTIVPNLWFKKMNPILEYWKEAVYQKTS